MNNCLRFKKSKDKPEALQAIIGLPKTLGQSTFGGLEAALENQFDIDGYLEFLAFG